MRRARYPDEAGPGGATLRARSGSACGSGGISMTRPPARVGVGRPTRSNRVRPLEAPRSATVRSPAAPVSPGPDDESPPISPAVRTSGTRGSLAEPA